MYVCMYVSMYGRMDGRMYACCACVEHARHVRADLVGVPVRA
jgi:hypothetical protein